MKVIEKSWFFAGALRAPYGLVEIGLVDSVVVSPAVEAGRCFITGEHGETLVAARVLDGTPRSKADNTRVMCRNRLQKHRNVLRGRFVRDTGVTMWIVRDFLCTLDKEVKQCWA